MSPQNALVLSDNGEPSKSDSSLLPLCPDFIQAERKRDRMSLFKTKCSLTETLQFTSCVSAHLVIELFLYVWRNQQYCRFFFSWRFFVSLCSSVCSVARRFQILIVMQLGNEEKKVGRDNPYVRLRGFDVLHSFGCGRSCFCINPWTLCTQDAENWIKPPLWRRFTRRLLQTSSMKISCFKTKTHAFTSRGVFWHNPFFNNRCFYVSQGKFTSPKK